MRHAGSWGALSFALCCLPSRVDAQESAPSAPAANQPALGQRSSAPAVGGNAQAASVEAALPAPSAGTHQVVTLNDGQELRGRVVKQSPQQIVLELEDGTLLPLPFGAIRAVEEAGTSGEAWGRDPNLSRYLYSPSAFTQGAGRGYLAQRAIVITSAGVGVTDFVDLEVGTILPLLFTEAPVAVGGAKLGVPVGDQLNVGLGGQAFFVEETVAGFAFANLTIGTHDSHVTLAGGGALEFTEGDLGAYVVTLSASHRLGPGTALITENWLFYFDGGDGPWDGPFFAVPSGGVRLFGPTFAVDLALVPVITLESELPVVPLPWLSFTWNWALEP